MAARPVVRHRGIRRAEPSGVVEGLGDRLCRRDAARLVEADAYLHALHLADRAVPDGVAHAIELAPAALLRADLHNGAVALREIREQTSLPDRLREGLLQPHRLACADRGGRDERMPEVGKAEHHGIHVLARTHFLVVVVCIDRISGEPFSPVGLLELLLCEIDAAGIEVAHRDYARDVHAPQHAGHLE